MSLDYTYLHSDELYNTDSRITNASGEKTTFHRFSLTGIYRINDQAILNSTIPVVDGLREETGAADKTINGPRDISVSVLWSPYSDSASSLTGLSFIGGLISPTGVTATSR